MFQWLLERFYEKEKHLEACYARDEDNVHTKTYPHVVAQRNGARTVLHAFLLLVLVACLVAVLCASQYARYVALLYLLVFVVVSYVGGFDRLVLALS